VEESYGIVAGITGVFIAGLSALGITKRVPLTYRYRGCTNNQRRGAPLTNLAGVRYKENKTTKFVSVVFLILLLASLSFAQQTATITVTWGVGSEVATVNVCAPSIEPKLDIGAINIDDTVF
jgi:hypothetical protein